MNDEDAIRDLLRIYEEALNTSDTDLALSCYAPDGVFMPTTMSTAAGTDLKKAYSETFERLRLHVTFTVNELVVTSPTSAYALTESHGAQTVLTSNQQTVESNREMFIFTKAGGSEWKISRYIFNKPQ